MSLSHRSGNRNQSSELISPHRRCPLLGDMLHNFRQICQPVCKPGSVWPDCFQPDAAAIHLGRMSPPASCNPPGRLSGNRLPDRSLMRRPYSVLLPMGFTVPLPLPAARWALTPPFHPYLPDALTGDGRRSALCCTFPEVTLAGRYPASCFHGARTFLTCHLSVLNKRGCPTG